MQYECVDEWTPGTCTREVMLAYKHLDTLGVIAIEHVQVGAITGKVIMRYRSTRAHDAVLLDLKRIKEEQAVGT